MNILTKINSELAIKKIEKKDSFLSSKKVVDNIELLIFHIISLNQKSIILK